MSGRGIALSGGATIAQRYMVRRRLVGCGAAVVLLALIGIAAPSVARAEHKSLRDRLTGAWSFASSINTRRDGSKFDRWGPNPSGIVIFDGSGHYSQMITSQDRFFGAKTVASFGRYVLNEATKTITIKIEGSTAPRAVGTTQRRIIISLTDDELRYLNPETTTGNKADVSWKRLK